MKKNRKKGQVNFKKKINEEIKNRQQKKKKKKTKTKKKKKEDEIENKNRQEKKKRNEGIKRLEDNLILVGFRSWKKACKHINI